jgi:hypothetical protein
MPVVLGNTNITGIAAGGLPNGVITRPNMGYPGAPVQMVTVQTRTQAEYAAPISGNGTNIALLNLTITPQKAGNRIHLDWFIHSEASSHDMVYIITRNDVLLPDTTTANNNRWAGIMLNHYDPNFASTPVIDHVKFIDTNSLSTASTYRILIRSSSGTARTYRLNRAFSSAGADSNEAGVSSGIAMEINT